MLVHKVLELVVTGFLEVLLVLEAVADELIHICFKLEQLVSEKDGIFEVVLVVHDFLSFVVDIRIHFMGD